MTTMVERIARAIYEAAWNSEPDQFVSELDELNGNMHATLDGEFDMRIFARAVLRAMREPSDRMGLGLPADYRPGSHSATDIWRSLIDAALKEGQ